MRAGHSLARMRNRIGGCPEDLLRRSWLDVSHSRPLLSWGAVLRHQDTAGVPTPVPRRTVRGIPTEPVTMSVVMRLATDTLHRFALPWRAACRCRLRIFEHPDRPTVVIVTAVRDDVVGPPSLAVRSSVAPAVGGRVPALPDRPRQPGVGRALPPAPGATRRSFLRWNSTRPRPGPVPPTLPAGP